MSILILSDGVCICVCTRIQRKRERETFGICIKYHSQPATEHGQTIIFTQHTIYHFKCLRCYFFLLLLPLLLLLFSCCCCVLFQQSLHLPLVLVIRILSLNLTLVFVSLCKPFLLSHFCIIPVILFSSSFPSRSLSVYRYVCGCFIRSVTLCLAASNTCDGYILQCHIYLTYKT